MSAPSVSEIFCGASVLPSDFDIFLPFSSTVKPCVSSALYGGAPFSIDEVSSDEWNQPRCWSEPSRYRSAGKASCVLVRAAQHGLVGGAGVEPDVQRVAVLLVRRRRRRPAARAGRASCQASMPFASISLATCSSSSGVRGCSCAGFLVQEEGHRHAPLALARQGPVRTVGDHAVQARLAPVREELGLVDAGQRGLAQGRAAVFRGDVHAGEPLAGGAVDDRGLVAPAVHVAVVEHLQFEQGAGFGQRGADRLGGFPDRHAAEQRQGAGEAAVAHHRLQDLVVLHAVRLAGLEVFQAVGRRRVDDAGAAVGGDVVGQVDRRECGRRTDRPRAAGA